MVNISQTRKIDVFFFFFFQKSQPKQQYGLIEKGLFPGKMLVYGWNLPYLEVDRIKSL